MKKFLMGFFCLVLGLGIMAGKTAPAVVPAHTPGPDIIVEEMDPSFGPYSLMWQTEVARRFHHAVMVEAHGGDFVNDVWVSQGSSQPWRHVIPAADLARQMQARYPDRTIVLISCNPGHVCLGVPGVYYADSSVWMMPDRAITAEVMKDARAFRMFDGPAIFSPIDIPTVQQPTRWQLEPDVVGNIWEFHCD